MSTLAKNVSQVVLYENQVSDFVALLWMQTPLGPRTIYECISNVKSPAFVYKMCHGDFILLILLYLSCSYYLKNLNDK